MMISATIEISEPLYMALQRLMDERKDLDLNTCFETAMVAYIEASKEVAKC